MVGPFGNPVQLSLIKIFTAITGVRSSCHDNRLQTPANQGKIYLKNIIEAGIDNHASFAVA